MALSEEYVPVASQPSGQGRQVRHHRTCGVELYTPRYGWILTTTTTKCHAPFSAKIAQISLFCTFKVKVKVKVHNRPRFLSAGLIPQIPLEFKSIGQQQQQLGQHKETPSKSSSIDYCEVMRRSSWTGKVFLEMSHLALQNNIRSGISDNNNNKPRPKKCQIFQKVL